MAIPEGKVRIAITIHKETKDLLNGLLSLHSEKFTYSNLIEIALLFYAKCVDEKINSANKKGGKKNAKN